MRTSDRLIAIVLAAVVWLIAGYALISLRPGVPERAATPSSRFDGAAAVGLAIGRP